MTNLESLRKTAREEFDNLVYDGLEGHAPAKYVTKRIRENLSLEEIKPFLDSKLSEAYLAGAKSFAESNANNQGYKEAYLAGAKDFEEAVRLEEEKLDDAYPITELAKGWNAALSAIRQKSETFWKENL